MSHLDKLAAGRVRPIGGQDARRARQDWESVFRLLNQTDRDWIAVEFPFARLNGGDDHQDQIQNVQYAKDHKPDQHQTKHTSDQIIDQHGDLKIERLFSMLVDFRRLAALGQPNNQRAKDVPRPWHEEADQRAGVAKYIPCSNI